MKTRSKTLMSILLCGAIVAVNIPAHAYESVYDTLFSPYHNKTEEEILEMKRKDSAEELISEIISIEAEIENINDTIVLLPHVTALVEKKDELSSQRILELLVQKNVNFALENALIKMYVEKGEDNNKLFDLLDNSELDKNSKNYIILTADFSLEKLIEIYEKYDDCSVTAMKLINVLNSDKAYELSKNIFLDKKNTYTNNKTMAACIGVREYLRKNTNENIIERMKEVYDLSSNELVKSQIIYSLSEMKKFENFDYIINNNDIDFLLKVSTIEANYKLLVNKLNTKCSEKEYECIKVAMKLHPILEVGEVLEDRRERLRSCDVEIQELINYIKTNGVEGVDKYD